MYRSNFNVDMHVYSENPKIMTFKVSTQVNFKMLFLKTGS
jgi:hypothetical protein